MQCQDDEGHLLDGSDIPSINAAAADVVRGPADSDGNAAAELGEMVSGQSASFKSLGHSGLCGFIILGLLGAYVGFAWAFYL